MRAVLLFIVLLYAGYVAWTVIRAGSDEKELKSVLKILRKHLWVLVLIAMVVLLGTYLITMFGLYGPNVKFI